MLGLRYSMGALALVALLSTVQGFAGEEAGKQRGQFNPEEFRARMAERMKENLGLSDDEFKAIQPKIDAVQKAQGNARVGGGGFGGFGGGRGGRGQGGGGNGGEAAKTDGPRQRQPLPENATDLQKKSRELSELLDNKEADPKAVKDKLAEVRDLREKAKVELKKAQDDLKEVLTPKQEAQLVMMGLLE